MPHHRLDEDGQGIELDVTVQGVRQTFARARATAPLPPRWTPGPAAARDHYEERATGSGARQALAIVEAAMEGVNGATLARA